jgi:hypothetical protein
MKPKQRLEEMQASLYEIITNQTDYSWIVDEKDGATIETPRGLTKIFLHYKRDGLVSKVNHEGSLEYQEQSRLNNLQNTSNLFYADGENFLCSEDNKLLTNANYKGARNYLSKKEQFVLNSQKKLLPKKEIIEFEKNLVVGRFPKLSPADYLSYIVAQEFGGGIRTYSMCPVFLRYPWITSENRLYNLVEEGFAKTRFISRQVSPRVEQFELIPVKPEGKLFVFAPRK